MNSKRIPDGSRGLAAVDMFFSTGNFSIKATVDLADGTEMTCLELNVLVA
jgi:hypothetical protein